MNVLIDIVSVICVCPSEASGPQYPHLKVLCLPEAPFVRGRQAETVHSLLPCWLLQSVRSPRQSFLSLE